MRAIIVTLLLLVALPAEASDYLGAAFATGAPALNGKTGHFGVVGVSYGAPVVKKYRMRATHSGAYQVWTASGAPDFACSSAPASCDAGSVVLVTPL